MPRQAIDHHLHRRRRSPAFPAGQFAISVVVPASRFIVLAVEEVEGFDDILFLKGRSFQGHHLALLPCQACSPKQVPPLNLSRKGDVVRHELAVGRVILRDVGQEALLRLPLKQVEVFLEVIWKKDPVVILKVLVQLLEDLAEGVALLHIFDGEVLEQLPGHPGVTADDVEH